MTDENYFVLTGMLQGKWTLDESGRLIPPASSDYALKHRDINALKTEIQTQQTNNPAWKAQKASEKEQIKKQNIELFGE